MVNRRCLCNPSRRFWKELIFQLFTPLYNSLSAMNEKAGTVSTVIVVCLALVAIMKDQVEQLNKIGVAALAIGIEEETVESRKVRDCV